VQARRLVLTLLMLLSPALIIFFQALRQVFTSPVFLYCLGLAPVSFLAPYYNFDYAQAWSSEREPSQVFKLLERTFSDFDRIAKKLGVFKVETIGKGRYVA
jgi:Adenylate and Guanylate cyclase catalytic domain